MSLDVDQRHALLGHPAGWIACGFGAGLSPFAPGTAGSLVALLAWLALRQLPIAYYALALALAFALGSWACEWAVRKLRIADPGAVVWDEFVGLWIALAPLVLWPRGWMWIFAGFVLFRIFDIVKPWPVSWADRKLHGGFGVMLDDVLAGIYAGIALMLLRLA
ncbi:MAG: phosphatidylglycerophosphatase A family protein [Rudaea sp.]